MKTGYFTKFATALLLTPALLIGTLPVSAQSYGRDDNRNQRTPQLQRRDQGYNQNRDQDRNQARNDQYRQSYDRDNNRRDYDGDAYRPNGYGTYAPAYTADYGYNRHDNGIGPGKGAAIGAVSGAVLGALFGGGKGAIIGGAAGAGVGAVAGQAAQENRRSRY
ncbi:MAG: YMGG-like glycine zipper-containing protein [Acidobacteriota bacterium]|nr:YMGG-like glycine zipper-containing protein [Acidobacteriota bacterium]